MMIQLLNNFINLFYPRSCILCRNPLIEHERHICLNCLQNLPETCYHTNKGNPARALFAGFPQVNEVTAFLFFEKDGKAQRLIHSFKYYGNKSLAEYLGRIAAIELKDAGFYASVDTLIPVPLHPDKEKKRGYNQSELIANGISSVYGCSVDRTSIKRIAYTVSQTRKSVYERHVNVEKIFKPTDTESLFGKHVLLVDDVITTGATTSACIEALLEIPEIKISIFSLAITMEN
ncbi:MAG: ComF family protein [Tannerella sp.]|jgi:ComF family protein|nr:ComF family protein [Tannerella sp.]